MKGEEGAYSAKGINRASWGERRVGWAWKDQRVLTADRIPNAGQAEAAA